MKEDAIEAYEPQSLRVGEPQAIQGLDTSLPSKEQIDQGLERASYLAKRLAQIVEDRKLYAMIQGRKYVECEAWTTLAAIMGYVPQQVSVKRLEDGSYEATVQLVRESDGAVRGSASALCEKSWRGGKAGENDRRSMALTRATSKVCRLKYSWIMVLAGFQPTPVEEMDTVIEAQKTTEKAPASSTTRSPRGVITDKQRKRIFAICKSTLSKNDPNFDRKTDKDQSNDTRAEVRDIIKKFGYNSTEEILVKDYEAIVEQVEGLAS